MCESTEGHLTVNLHGAIVAPDTYGTFGEQHRGEHFLAITFEGGRFGRATTLCCYCLDASSNTLEFDKRGDLTGGPAPEGGASLLDKDRLKVNAVVRGGPYRVTINTILVRKLEKGDGG